MRRVPKAGWGLPWQALLLVCFLSACSLSSSRKPGGYYEDDGPGDDIPGALDDIPDARPRVEKLSAAANRPYVVFGKRYVPNTRVQPFRQRGMASWYGKKFHGKKTSTGERYDMFAMTAAHPTLALPSYARVTNVGNGRTIIVRVIDRGPFLAGRVMDLSYAAAHRLGYIKAGKALVDVEAIVPNEAPSFFASVKAAVAETFEDNTGIGDDAAPNQAGAVAEGHLLGALIARAEEDENAGGTSVASSAEPAPVFLQLGAFANAENAENFRVRLALELSDLAEPLRVMTEGGVFRVRLGPYPDRDAAAAAAQRIRETLGYHPAFVTP